MRYDSLFDTNVLEEGWMERLSLQEKSETWKGQGMSGEGRGCSSDAVEQLNSVDMRNDNETTAVGCSQPNRSEPLDAYIQINQQCYCNTADYCNAAATLLHSLSVVLLPFCVLVVQF
ncbi:unnamed protein product [Anisakis simplex]|uniref:GDNF domain-containing protein n=1 Tax=Anisakis simplex TaxID=6269 RepID=A0A0M3KCR3_ANISI|nr:unnamed protein product [Anisakis simplex]